jgi:hypothetical protein
VVKVGDHRPTRGWPRFTRPLQPLRRNRLRLGARADLLVAVGRLQPGPARTETPLGGCVLANCKKLTANRFSLSPCRNLRAITRKILVPMPEEKRLVALLRQLLARRKNVVEKRMFGGTAFLLHGNVCCGAWKVHLILRLGPDAARQVLAEEHTREFDITGRPMRGWVMVEPAGWDDAARLRRWVSWAVEFTNALPPK